MGRISVSLVLVTYNPQKEVLFGLLQRIKLQGQNIFMKSLTKPYINNPIGMSMILISLLNLHDTYKHQKVTHA